jgi:hypothetical protein
MDGRERHCEVSGATVNRSSGDMYRAQPRNEFLELQNICVVSGHHSSYWECVRLMKVPR